MQGQPTFFEVLTAAVADFAEHGYASERQLAEWMEQIRLAAERDLVPPHVMEEELRSHLGAIYKRLVDSDGLLKTIPMDRFTWSRLKPSLRDELSKRITASAALIKLNREEAISNTLRRFAGWATSIPEGGSPAVAKNPAKSDIRKALARTPFEVRRCQTDQGHKLVASLHEVTAVGAGAIAAKWHHHYVRYPRRDHVAREGKIYLVRGSWAHEKGFVKPSAAGFYDQITKPGEEISCRCSATYLMNLRQLPPEMLTDAGRAALAEARSRIAALR